MRQTVTDEALRRELTSTAHAMADAARGAVLSHFRQDGLTAENKLGAGFDPVTEADKAAERAMRAVLGARRPEDAIIGEEYGAEAGASGLTWVLDPIDGTRGFLSGTPTWGVLIAVGGAGGPSRSQRGGTCGLSRAGWRRGARRTPPAGRCRRAP